jgi:hypothetical protein
VPRSKATRSPKGYTGMEQWCRPASWCPAASSSCITSPYGVSLGGFDQSVIDFLIELFRHRSHTFVAMLPKERGRPIVFESRGASLVLIEHDPERGIQACRQFMWVEKSTLPITYCAALRFPERICNQSPCVAKEKTTRPASPWIFFSSVLTRAISP